jgi:hypothetical protein
MVASQPKADRAAKCVRVRLLGIQLLVGERTAVTDTPNPTEDGVVFTTPEILPEGDPRQRPDLFVPKST